MNGLAISVEVIEQQPIVFGNVADLVPQPFAEFIRDLRRRPFALPALSHRRTAYQARIGPLYVRVANFATPDVFPAGSCFLLEPKDMGW